MYRRYHSTKSLNVLFALKLGGAHPKKNQKKTSRYTKIGKLALVFFGFFFGFFKFPNWHWFFLVFFWFFLVFFGFFWHWFWPEFEIGNWFFLVIFGFFFGFFGIGLGQYSKLETGFLGSVGFFWFFLGFFGFFWYLNLGLEYHPKKTKKKNQKKNKKKPKKTKKPKKNQKKPVATPKLVNWLGFFWFFWGEHPPNFESIIFIIMRINY